MDLRITPQSLLARQLGYLRTQTDQMAVFQQQASTGKRLVRPSDDPLDMVALMRTQAEEGRIEANQANTRTARSRLDGANSVLLEVTHLFTRAREAALEGANSGLDASDRAALAGEVEQLVERLVAEANTRIDGHYIFGGTATDRAPFTVTARDAQGRVMAVSYQGSPNAAAIPVGEDQKIDTFYAGDQVWMKPGQDAFQALIGLRDDLLNKNGLSDPAVIAALQARLDGLEQSQGGTLEVVGEVSSSLSALEKLDQRLDDLGLQARERASNLESADMASVVVELSTQQTLFSASLAISARISDQSLLDFLS